MNGKLEREILTLPEDAGAQLRRNLKLGDEKLRISYINGPGDVVGTYGYWREGRADPRVPVVTYSAQFYELAQRIGASVQMITLFDPPADSGPDIRFAQVKRQPWSDRKSYYKSQSDYARDVAAQIDAFDPHIVIASLDFPASGWKKIKKPGRKLVVTAHNTFWPMGRKPTGLKGALKMKLLEHRSKALDGAVCTSPECARQIGIVTRGRIRGRAEHTQIVAHYDVEERKRVRRLLYLGRIERSKGIFMLLNVFVRLKSRFPDLDLTFAGSGNCDDELHAAVAGAGVPDVRFLGRLDSAGVHREIADTDLIVCPTTSAFDEGLALVGLEGAAHGIPTLLSTVVPAIDVLGDACKSFQVDDAADLERALSDLITDEAEYQALLTHLDEVRPRLYDPSLSWGSQLAQVLLEL